MISPEYLISIRGYNGFYTILENSASFTYGSETRAFSSHKRIGTNEIGFIDPQKTKEISQRGVNFHVKYPTMENKQLIRSLLLTTLLTAIVSLFLANLYHSSRKTIISIKEKYNITITKKFQYFINTLIILLLGGISYYSYILIFNDKVLISESDIWYYISSVIVGVFLVLVSIFIAYKKLK